EPRDSTEPALRERKRPKGVWLASSSRRNSALLLNTTLRPVSNAFSGPRWLLSAPAETAKIAESILCTPMPDRILVVDDEEAIREIVCAILAAAGYSWKQAASGMEALALLNSGEQFELMLSDLMMADLDGIGLLERTKEKYPDMPVVMGTAVHDISVALAAIRNGAYDYLLKPFERDQLLATVSRAVENRRLKLENRTYQSNLESLVEARTVQLQAAMSSLERSYDITLEAL